MPEPRYTAIPGCQIQALGVDREEARMTAAKSYKWSNHLTSNIYKRSRSWHSTDFQPYLTSKTQLELRSKQKPSLNNQNDCHGTSNTSMLCFVRRSLKPSLKANLLLLNTQFWQTLKSGFNVKKKKRKSNPKEKALDKWLCISQMYEIITMRNWPGQTPNSHSRLIFYDSHIFVNRISRLWRHGEIIFHLRCLRRQGHVWCMSGSCALKSFGSWRGNGTTFIEHPMYSPS